MLLIISKNDNLNCQPKVTVLYLLTQRKSKDIRVTSRPQYLFKITPVWCTQTADFHLSSVAEGTASVYSKPPTMPHDIRPLWSPVFICDTQYSTICGSLMPNTLSRPQRGYSVSMPIVACQVKKTNKQGTAVFRGNSKWDPS